MSRAHGSASSLRVAGVRRGSRLSEDRERDPAAGSREAARPHRGAAAYVTGARCDGTPVREYRSDPGGTKQDPTGREVK